MDTFNLKCSESDDDFLLIEEVNGEITFENICQTPENVIFLSTENVEILVNNLKKWLEEK